MWVIAVQTIAAGVVAGVGFAWIAYAVGVDRVIVRGLHYLGYAVIHPLRTAELIIAIPMSWLPAPRVKRRPRHLVGVAA